MVQPATFLTTQQMTSGCTIQAEGTSKQLARVCQITRYHIPQENEDLRQQRKEITYCPDTWERNFWAAGDQGTHS